VRTPPDEQPVTPALSALVDLQRDAAKPRSATELDRGLATVRARVAADRSRRPILVRGVVLGLAMGLVALAAPRLWRAVRAPAATVAVQRIDGGALLDGGYLAQSGSGGVEVTFNEGTHFKLAAGTRGRLRELRRDGAALSIENGAASFQVTPDPSRRWSVEAGPFLITVKGTVFDVTWDPATERFDLTLRRGRVQVSGPVVGGGITLNAGQHLAVRLPLAETIITETANEQSAGPDDKPAGEAAPPPVNPGASTPGRVPAAKRPGPRAAAEPAAPSTPTAKQPDARGWQAWLAAGQWDRILRDAERAGIPATLEQASSEDLFALADVARYRHRAELARSALLAQRRRFPSSPRALDAIFLLGRVAEVGDGAARATALYDEYLARAPYGPYAGEALGRKMILSNEHGQPTQARTIARQYLLRFPSGSYAAAARALTREP